MPIIIPNRMAINEFAMLFPHYFFIHAVQMTNGLLSYQNVGHT